MATESTATFTLHVPSFINDIRQASIDFINKYHWNELPINDKNDAEELSANIFCKYHLNHEQLCTENNIKNCKTIERICEVLKFYNETINQFDVATDDNKSDPDHIQSLLNNINLIEQIQFRFGNEYTIQHILNDHVHITLKHQHYLEDIYNFNNIKCNLSECNGIKRIHRDRTREELQTNNVHCNENNLVILDVLDQIHCYLLHTFDIGFKLTQNEKLIIYKNEIEQKNKNIETEINETDNIQIDVTNNEYNQINSVLKDKRKVYSYSIDGLHRIQHSTFVTNVSTSSDNKSDDKKLNDTEQNMNLYSFSRRFYYWKYYKNNTSLDWSNPGDKYQTFYVGKKYTNLKDEILNNLICNISNKKWSLVYEKGIKYHNTPHCNTIKSVKYRFNEYNVKSNEKISIKHIISLLLYTDFTELSYSFSLSFRRQNENEILLDIKKRHSNYYWWAKTLRESVECFGNEINKSRVKYFWHGISKPMVFQSSIATFNCPTSTTTEFEVASNFATKGIIVKLTGFYKTGSGGYYFNCSWLSCYSNENERLFIGGYWPLQFEDIINCMNGSHYSVYLHAFNILNAAMNGMPLSSSLSSNQIPNKMDKHIIKHLLNDSAKCKTFDPYFMNIFRSFRENTHFIRFDLFYLGNDKNDVSKIGQSDFCGYSFLGKMLLTNPSKPIESFVKLDIISNLFQNMHNVYVKYSGGYDEPIIMTDKYLETVYNSLCNQKIHELKINKVKITKKYPISQFKGRFQAINYGIYIEDGDICFHRLHNVKVRQQLFIYKVPALKRS